MWLSVLLTIATLVACVLFKSFMRTVWTAWQMPGYPAWPVIGNADVLINTEKMIQMATEGPTKYGSVMRAWMAVVPCVVVFDPRHIQKILHNSKHIEKNFVYRMLRNFVGAGLTTMDGARWKIHRKLMQPSFSLSILEDLVEVFSRGGISLVDKLTKASELNSEGVNVTSLVNTTVFSVLSEAILGVPMNSPEAKSFAEESPYRQGSNSLTYRMMRPWLLLPGVFKRTQRAQDEYDQKNALLAFTKKALADRKNRLSLDPMVKKCFVDELLQLSTDNPVQFTENDCALQATTLMLAGQDSVGASLAFTLQLLANHPKAQENVIKEQDMIFMGSDRPATLHDLRQMVYLEMCIKEALRLYPSIPVIGRRLETDLVLGKWNIPKGCNVLIAPYATHRLQEFYPDPEAFKPERFTEEEVAKRPLDSYLPFSSGPRNCIGYKFAELEMKTVLSAVLRAFSLTPVKGKENIVLDFKVTLRAKGGLWVNCTPRKPAENFIVSSPN